MAIAGNCNPVKVGSASETLIKYQGLKGSSTPSSISRGCGTCGYTRANNSKAVPGGNGSWNVDAYGKLYRDFLVITFPNKPDGTGPEIIPTHRLLSIRFGDGGIKEMPKTAAP